jgi:hypothetical protein
VNPPVTQLRWDDQTSANGEWYFLRIKEGGFVYWKQWVTQAETMASGSERYYMLPGDLDLPAGAYSWDILPWNSTGYGLSSALAEFTVN